MIPRNFLARLETEIHKKGGKTSTFDEELFLETGGSTIHMATVQSVLRKLSRDSFSLDMVLAK